MLSHVIHPSIPPIAVCLLGTIEWYNAYVSVHFSGSSRYITSIVCLRDTPHLMC
jgi:hypothetical protein